MDTQALPRRSDCPPLLFHLTNPARPHDQKPVPASISQKIILLHWPQDNLFPVIFSDVFLWLLQNNPWYAGCIPPGLFPKSILNCRTKNWLKHLKNVPPFVEPPSVFAATLSFFPALHSSAAEQLPLILLPVKYLRHRKPSHGTSPFLKPCLPQPAFHNALPMPVESSNHLAIPQI